MLARHCWTDGTHASRSMDTTRDTSRRWLSFAVLLGLAWALTAGVLLANRWPDMGQRLFDGDDAMRLVEVREFIGGRGWFDLHEARLDPPTGYDTHWSRLIDAGLAGLYLAARPFTTPDLAERLMRAIWPLLWLLVAMSAVAALAWRLAGRNAALIAVLLAACAIPAYQHFKPGRIDHHNVQIALALAVLAAAAWSDRARRAAPLAGALTGLAAAIGLESVPILATVAAAMALRFAWGEPAGTAEASPAGTSAAQLARYGVAVAASMLIGFLVNVAPAHWTVPECDAMAINWLLAAAVGGLGLAAAAHATGRAGRAARFAAVGVVGAAALLVFVLVEPRCIHGPFAQIDPDVKAMWLDHVDEMETLVGFVRGFPLVGAWMCAFPLVGLLALGWLGREQATRRDFAFLLTAAAFAVSVATTFDVEKIYAYAMWFAMPLVAALAAQVAGASASPGWRVVVVRLAAALVLTPTSVTAAAMMAIQTVDDANAAKPGIAERVVCTRDAAYAPLVRLTPGLVVTDVNYGPYVLALTPHAVVAAPYHRIVGGIVAADAILGGSLDDARRTVAARGVTYVAICGHRTSTGVTPAAGTLWGELEAGRIPAWLASIPGSTEGQFAVYRVRPQALRSTP